MDIRTRWYKLTHWEFWSFNTIYFPIIWYYLMLCVRARSFFFFNSANPFIKNGGFLLESKWEIHQITPTEITPVTFLIRNGEDLETALKAASNIGYPLIAKPDIGGKGRGVALLHHARMLAQYHAQCPVDYLLQALIPFENEVGVFYVRDPETDTGIITGVVEKRMLTVTGDGRSTIAELLLSEPRWQLYRKSIMHSLGGQAQQVLAKGQKELLVPYGNHARGATFFDITHKVNQQLVNTIDRVCRQVPEFHFGRIDIRYQSWEELCAGKNFSIVEINGAGSEPTHMYDPSKSLWQGWGHIIEHWRWLHLISMANRKRGFRYLTISEGLQMFRETSAYDRRLSTFHFSPVDTQA